MQYKKIEMRLRGIAGIFWQYSYIYGYSIDNEYLVRYEGPGESKNLEMLELVKVVN